MNRKPKNQYETVSNKSSQSIHTRSSQTNCDSTSTRLKNRLKYPNTNCRHYAKKKTEKPKANTQITWKTN